MENISVEIPLRITLSFGTQAPAAQPANLPTGISLESGLERVDIDRDYSNRRGYDPEFLGVTLQLPILDEDQRRNAAKNNLARPDQDSAILPYHHFSIVLNRRRQLAYYTAVNIDGQQARNPNRSGDRWYFDPRIAESEQIGEDLYARNALDRGHLVRRLDPAWGFTAAEALAANNDTFHFTNCSPQHARFNQSSETWQGIENYLLDQARQDRKRLTVFTGPVLGEDDPLYRGVRLPVYFWKIAAFVKQDGGLSVSAYLLDQKELVAGLERFSASTFQVTVEEIIGRTGLDFSPLVPVQVDFAAEDEAGGLEGLERSIPVARRRLDHVTSVRY